MSATGRSDVRRPNDHYVTPDWCVKRFLEAYSPPNIVTNEGEKVLWCDPCAANGELIRVVRNMHPHVSVSGIELRADCGEALVRATGNNCLLGDFFEIAKLLPDLGIHFIITNPPYSLTEKFIKTALRVSKTSAWLLRINAVRGAGRQKLFDEHKPGMFVLPDRPSFTGRGTDATEYGWFVFGDPSVKGRWDMLAETPEEDRARWNKRAREIHGVPAPEGALPALP